MKKMLLFIFIFINTATLIAKETNSTKDYIKNPKNPMIAIITTGGTIAEIKDPKTGAVVPGNGKALLHVIPEVFEFANVRYVEFSNIDSSQMTPELWLKLSQKTDELLADKEIVGAVITHGTDLMAESAFFLDLTLKSNKPVVFTGAMKNSSDPHPDGPANLYNAVIQVLSKNAQNWGVTVTLNQYINGAKNVVKSNTTNPQTFVSGEKGYLGFIFDDKVYRLNDTLYKLKFPIPKKIPKVYIFQDYAGAGDDIIRFMTDNNADGIVVEGLGSGNVNANVFKGIQYALNKGVIVIVTSTVPHGGVFPIYGDEGGGETLKSAGAILSTFLRADKARILLLLALPHIGKNKEKLSKYFNKPY